MKRQTKGVATMVSEPNPPLPLLVAKLARSVKMRIAPNTPPKTVLQQDVVDLQHGGLLLEDVFAYHSFLVFPVLASLRSFRSLLYPGPGIEPD